MSAAPDLDIDVARLELVERKAIERHQAAEVAGRDTRTTQRRLDAIRSQLEPMRRALEALEPIADSRRLSGAEVVAIGNDAIAGPDGYAYTDLGNAKRLVARHGEHLRYLATWGRWVVFDGSRWVLDHGDTNVRRHAAELGPEMLRLIAEVRDDERRMKALIGHARRSENASGIVATVSVARSQSEVAIHHEDLDANAWALNLRNGTLDLESGRFRRPRPSDYITMQAAVSYDPGASAPEWARLLERVQPDPEVRALLQRLAGLSLVGKQIEHVLPVMIGGGANGKSTVTRIMASVLGDYAVVASRDLLLALKHDTHPTSKADLFRKRFAHLGELPAGARLDEAQVKELTGGDRITARRMREDPWQFDPSHLLWLHANHRPAIEGTDDGIWRRVLLIPFDVQVPEAERDPHLADRIIANESPGVLRWMLDGLADYRAGGLRPPARVRAATDAYRRESDTVALFASQAGIVIDAALEVTANDLMQAHAEWFAAAGIAGTEKGHYQRVTTHLTSTGATKRKSRSRGGWYWLGVGMVDEDQPRQPAPPLPYDAIETPSRENQPEPLAHVGAGVEYDDGGVF